MTNKQTIKVSRELLERVEDLLACPQHHVRSEYITAYTELRGLLDHPACSTCKGTRVVDDGELTHSSGGIPFEMGPIKCVKDCPHCTPSAQPAQEVKQQGEAVACFAGAHSASYPSEQPAPVAVALPDQTVRRAFICKGCEGVYADEAVSKCDCMCEPDFVEGEISYAEIKL